MPKKSSGVQHNESIVFFAGDFLMAMCFRSHLILFMKHIKAAGLNKRRTIKSKNCINSSVIERKKTPISPVWLRHDAFYLCVRLI